MKHRVLFFASLLGLWLITALSFFYAGASRDFGGISTSLDLVGKIVVTIGMAGSLALVCAFFILLDATVDKKENIIRSEPEQIIKKELPKPQMIQKKKIAKEPEQEFEKVFGHVSDQKEETEQNIEEDGVQ